MRSDPGFSLREQRHLKTDHTITPHRFEDGKQG